MIKIDLLQHRSTTVSQYRGGTMPRKPCCADVSARNVGKRQCRQKLWMLIWRCFTQERPLQEQLLYMLRFRF